jgi:hypothetical protein
MPADELRARRHASQLLRKAIIKTVDFCTRHAWPVIVVALILGTASGVYAARHSPSTPTSAS